jgi:hypothetical protein
VQWISPSDHVGIWSRLAVLTVATVVGALDRLVVGAHWLTDVAGSLAPDGVISAAVLAAQATVPRAR